MAKYVKNAALRFLFLISLSFAPIMLGATQLYAGGCASELVRASNLHQAITDLIENYSVAHQFHPQLDKPRNGYRTYLIKEGGLCGPTSTTILLTAINHFYGVKTHVLPEDIVETTDLIARIGRDDARDGVTTRPVMTAIRRVTKARGQKVKVSNLAVDYLAGTPVAKKFDASLFKNDDENTLYLLATQGYSPDASVEDNYDFAHFSVGFNFDPHSNSLQVIDPLYPSKIFTAYFVPATTPETHKPSLALQYRPRTRVHWQRAEHLLSEVITVKVSPPPKAR